VTSQQKTTRLIVDCQLLQTGDRDRGMGRFFNSLLANLKDRDETLKAEWTFLLNQRLPDIKSQDKKLLTGLGGSIIYADFLHAGDRELFGNAAKVNKSKLDKTVASLLEKHSHQKTVFFIPALFSSEIYPVFPTHGTTNVLLFYDLIPYLYHQHYFRDPQGSASKDYSQRFREFYKTDLFLAISQTTADDLNIYFGVDPSRIIPILGAGANRTGLKPKQPGAAHAFQNDYVLMPSGDDLRKNNILAARAFNLLEGETKLVITSNFSDGSKRLLSQLCPRVVFTGNVSDEEYLWLIDNAKTVFFPTEYEGLGMPVLEAVERNTTIVCSNTPVFTEISREAFFYCDPSSINSMKESLELALHETSRIERANKKQHYAGILDKFSWPKTAGLFLRAISICEPAPLKKKLAMFCPSPSSYSAVGKYTFETHAELSRIYDIDYFVEEGQTDHPPTRLNILEYAANYYPATDFDPVSSKDYDCILYNIGNSEFHTETILNALRFPANAIIHDTKLNGVFDYMTNRGVITPERRQYEGLLDEVLKTRNTACLASIATNQKTIFCYSRFARDSIRDILLAQPTPVLQVMQPIGVPSVELVRPDKPTISFAGIISESKGISLVSEVSSLGDVNVKVFGFGVLGDSPLLESLGDNVEIIKDLTDKEFQDMLRKSDILVNYRVNYQGETSRTTLEAMRYGSAVIVRKIGWFDEIPDVAVVKVDSEREVIEAVRTLVGSPGLRQKLSNAARSLLATDYSYERYAKLIEEGMQRNNG
jgi:glycosyltransferase involved in cell wall biosynthesis